MKLKIIKFKSVKSTNDKAIKSIQKHKQTSGFIISDFQTKGRGTMGKKWISKKGNIFISIFFKINFSKIIIENFLMINTNIIKKILKSYVRKKITIKKPNDLLIENKKICGILQEVVEYNDNKFLITGIGINTRNTPSEKKIISTCLNDHTNKIIKNSDIIKKIKYSYEKMINDLNNNNFTYIKNKYI
jgi:BirA family biotin operon repressor/biotin-[acetyl-CoA-carboxylase] ligase